MSKVFSSAKELKEGKYVIIDGVPCRVVSIDSSKPGKHGAAKMRVVGIGIFDGQKKTLLTPSDADVEVPIIERRSAQIIAVSGNIAQLMDIETFETYELPIPQELAGKVEAGRECEIMEALGKRAIIRVKGE
ncbi:MAG: translation initiation factor IF-5A [Candidatus Anstonellales archaeon]